MGCGSTCSLRLVDIIAQTIEPLPVSLDYLGEMVWSPDGHAIVYISILADGTQQVCVYRLDTSAETCLGEYANQGQWGSLSWWKPRT